MTLPLVENASYGMEQWCYRGAVVTYRENYLTDAERIFREIERDVSSLARNEAGVMYGKPYVSARKTVQLADPGIRLYKYSGASASQTHPFDRSPAIQSIREKLEKDLGVRFNFCLVNIYPPDASLGWHADDEADMAPDMPVASVSLGCRRKFRFRPKKKEDAEGWRDYWLELGSLLVMAGACQRVLEHSVPKTTRAQGVRINLTFRMMLAAK